MPIPSEAEFQQAIDACQEAKEIKIVGEFSPQLFITLEPSHTVLTRLVKIMEHSDETASTAMNMPASLWMRHERFAQRAYESIRKQIGRMSLEDVARRVYKSVSMLVHGRSLAYGPQRYVPVSDAILEADIQRLMRLFQPLIIRWLSATLPAFHEYFYHPSAVEDLIKDQKRLDTLAAEAMSGRSALSELAQIAVKMGAAPHFAEMANGRINAYQRFVLDALRRAKANSIPVARNDRTARERLLIWRLWSGLTTNGVPTRPVAMKNLLRVDGVENNVDDRAVDLMLKKFSEQRTAKRKLSEANASRYLKQSSEATTTG